jgi:hypothetical protein
MQRRHILLLVIVIGVSLLLANHVWNRHNPDWIALYEQKLGQPIEELSEAPLVVRLEADGWDHVRITSVDLEDGTMLLIGLPAANQDSPEDIVESSVMLRLDDARERCQKALDPREYSWGWDGSVDEETTRFVIQATPWTPWKDVGDGIIRESLAISSPTDPYCELVFSDQWQLNVVQPVGVIEAAP